MERDELIEAYHSYLAHFMCFLIYAGLVAYLNTPIPPKKDLSSLLSKSMSSQLQNN